MKHIQKCVKHIQSQGNNIWMMMMYKIDLNEIDNLQKTINYLTILKNNCQEEDIQHWENLIDYYTALQKGEIELN